MSLNLLRLLAGGLRVDGRESTSAPLSVAEATTAIRTHGDLLIERALGQVDRAPVHDVDAKRRVQEVLAHHGRSALDIVTGGDERRLNAVQRTSLEALIKLTGRPALRVRSHSIDFNDPQLGDWQGPLVLLKPDIPKLTRSVGRIDLQGNHVGTGFMIAEDLIMTNRHVLEALAVPFPGPANSESWTIHEDVSIDFRREQGSGETERFAILEVVFSGPTPTNDSSELQLTDLDVAILRIEMLNAIGQKAPPALPFLAGEITTHAYRDVLVIGFPARPAALPLGSDGEVRDDVIGALRRIFDLQYGVKYLSPGAVSTGPGELAGDVRQWVFGHDATTLAGNSGSCVVRYGPRPGIIGLHFAGELERVNYAHAIQRLVAAECLPPAVLERLEWIREPE